MGIQYVTSKDFNRDPGRAKRAADDGAVFITNRSEPTHVLMRIEEFRRLTQAKGSIIDKLAMPEVAHVDFDPPRIVPGLRPASFD
jgi:prevent-host-death family protein